MDNMSADNMSAGQTVAVYGAYGHTGEFAVAELLKRGFNPRLAGRDAGKLGKLAKSYPGLESRLAGVDDPAALDHAFRGAAAVINCAGPFAVTAAPVIEAALRARIPYVDVAAEIEANVDTFTRFADRARDEKATIVPAMAFFGAFGDLLATAAMGDWTDADEVHVAYGLSSWHPTAGTRAAGKVSRQRRDGRGVRYANHQLEYHDDELSTLPWEFPEPMGTRTVIAEFTMADVVTIPSHLKVPNVRTYMTTEAASDLADPNTPARVAEDPDQTFVIDVVVRSGNEERRATASGRDIYAVTAPLAVEAIRRILSGQVRTEGVASAGEIFDAAAFLNALAESWPGETAGAAIWWQCRHCPRALARKVVG